jgi:hypothetical protein
MLRVQGLELRACSLDVKGLGIEVSGSRVFET